MLAPMFLALLVMIYVFRRINNVINSVQRLDGVYRGPLSTNFTNAVSGLVTLRTFERLPFFKANFIDDLDKSCNATFTMFCLQRHLIIQLDMTVIFVTSCAAIFMLY